MTTFFGVVAVSCLIYITCSIGRAVELMESFLEELRRWKR